jgi:hypothetical protein
VFFLIGDILPNSELKMNEKKSDFGGFHQISIFDF